MKILACFLLVCVNAVASAQVARIHGSCLLIVGYGHGYYMPQSDDSYQYQAIGNEYDRRVANLPSCDDSNLKQQAEEIRDLEMARRYTTVCSSDLGGWYQSIVASYQGPYQELNLTFDNQGFLVSQRVISCGDVAQSIPDQKCVPARSYRSNQPNNSLITNLVVLGLGMVIEHQLDRRRHNDSYDGNHDPGQTQWRRTDASGW